MHLWDMVEKSIIRTQEKRGSDKITNGDMTWLRKVREFLLPVFYKVRSFARSGVSYNSRERLRVRSVYNKR